MRNIRLTIAYDGTRYGGWQRQINRRSIQQVLEEAVASIVQEPVHIAASGRTDAGVHALGQTANFKSSTRLSCSRLKTAINSRLPEDIRVEEVRNSPIEFHARFSAKSKIYRYRIWNADTLPVLERHALHHYPGRLDPGRMKAAARTLAGRRDFASFGSKRGPGSEPATTIRHLKRVQLSKKGPLITIELEADGFLYKMVRSIVGTLIEVGRGRITQAQFREIISRRDRSWAGKTAPAKGLCLVAVKY